MRKKDIIEYSFAMAVLVRAAEDAFRNFCDIYKGIYWKFEVENDWVFCDKFLRACCVFNGTMEMSYTALTNLLYNLKDSEKVSMKVSVRTNKGKRVFRVEIPLIFDYETDQIAFK